MFKLSCFFFSIVSSLKALTLLLLFTVLPSPASCAEQLSHRFCIPNSPIEKCVLLLCSFLPDFSLFFEKIKRYKNCFEQVGFGQPPLFLRLDSWIRNGFATRKMRLRFMAVFARNISMLHPNGVILTVDGNATGLTIHR